MWATIKDWYWYDWMIVIIRLICLVNISINIVIYSSWTLKLNVFMIFMTAIILTIPLFIKQISRKWYLISEIVLVGTYHIYLSSEWVQSPFQFALIVFIIGMSSDRNLYLWTAFPCIFIIPAINGLIVGESIQSILLYFFLNHAAVFIMGYAFQILMQSHKLIKKIEDQNRVLEQHLKRLKNLRL